jgi:hypothetical protein
MLCEKPVHSFDDCIQLFGISFVLRLLPQFAPAFEARDLRGESSS